MPTAEGQTIPYHDLQPHRFTKDLVILVPDIYNKNVDTMYNAPLLPDAAYTDNGLVKDTNDRVAKDNNIITIIGNYTRFNNKLSVEENLKKV